MKPINCSDSYCAHILNGQKIISFRPTGSEDMAVDVGVDRPPAGAPDFADVPDNNDTLLELPNQAGEHLGSVDVCVEQWCNAGPEARKKMFTLFAYTGVFVCLCRHGQLLIMCNMI